MLYVSVAPNGYAMVSTVPPENAFYVEVENLPAGDGHLMLSSDGTLYRLEPTPEPEPVEPEPTPQDDTDAMLVDHELRLTMLELGLTEEV